MSAPVDLTNLHEITGCDAELEAELFAQFHEAFAQGIAGLEAALATADTDQWRRHAHALKGISLNLGANALGDLCKRAQDSTVDATDKPFLLSNIHQEYAHVRDFLSALPAG